MSRRAAVYNNETLAGYLEKESGAYLFTYDESYVNDSKQPAISLTLPKNQIEYKSDKLFPFFWYYYLKEQTNKFKVSC